ncbi:unnamed protein product [Caenorhabditis bovis]|uniref:CX domain-containing protein n=1 Tax=Caenorhabditis bovis TaxID=2654633 RepID=A0A8S1E804_9PELO|nr:unnamed protein product [Caenorhabditis bovis]
MSKKLGFVFFLAIQLGVNVESSTCDDATALASKAIFANGILRGNIANNRDAIDRFIIVNPNEGINANGIDYWFNKAHLNASMDACEYDAGGDPNFGLVKFANGKLLDTIYFNCARFDSCNGLTCKKHSYMDFDFMIILNVILAFIFFWMLIIFLFVMKNIIYLLNKIDDLRVSMRRLFNLHRPQRQYIQFVDTIPPVNYY